MTIRQEGKRECKMSEWQEMMHDKNGYLSNWFFLMQFCLLKGEERVLVNAPSIVQKPPAQVHFGLSV